MTTTTTTARKSKTNGFRLWFCFCFCFSLTSIRWSTYRALTQRVVCIMSFEPAIWLWVHRIWLIRLNPLRSLLKSHYDGHRSMRNCHCHRLHLCHSLNSIPKRFSAPLLYTIYLTKAAEIWCERRKSDRCFNGFEFVFTTLDIFPLFCATLENWAITKQTILLGKFYRLNKSQLHLSKFGRHCIGSVVVSNRLHHEYHVYHLRKIKEEKNKWEKISKDRTKQRRFLSRHIE